MTLPEGTNSLSWLQGLCWPDNQMQSPSCALIKTEPSVSIDKLIGTHWERQSRKHLTGRFPDVFWDHATTKLSALMLATTAVGNSDES